MSLLQQIIALSHRIASSLLRDEGVKELENSSLLSEKDKKYVTKQITNKTIIKERLSVLSQVNVTEDWEKVRSKIKQPVFSIYSWKIRASAASIIVLLASSVYFYTNDFNASPTELPLVVKQIGPGTNKAILTLANGEEVVLDKGQSYKDKNVDSDGEELLYKQGSKENKIAYNELTIPRGGQFFIKLSDGTKIWLNSESKIKYQVSFIDGLPRQVELVYGEAYFDVSPSIKHKGSEFTVYHKKQQIQVLGTSFNVKAYKDESEIQTTLAEGKVALNYEHKKAYLRPNEQSTYSTLQQTLIINEVDVYNSIAWKNGIFSFEGMSLKEIMKVLSRWYDVEIVFKNPMAESQEFVGVLGKDQNLETILQSIKSYGIIKNYELKNKKIVLY